MKLIKAKIKADFKGDTKLESLETFISVASEMLRSALFLFLKLSLAVSSHQFLAKLFHTEGHEKDKNRSF